MFEWLHRTNVPHLGPILHARLWIAAGLYFARTLTLIKMRRNIYNYYHSLVPQCYYTACKLLSNDFKLIKVYFYNKVMNYPRFDSQELPHYILAFKMFSRRINHAKFDFGIFTFLKSISHPNTRNPRPPSRDSYKSVVVHNFTVVCNLSCVLYVLFQTIKYVKLIRFLVVVRCIIICVFSISGLFYFSLHTTLLI